MGIAIRAENLSKEYRLGVINHGMLYKDMQSWLSRKLGRQDPHARLGNKQYSEQSYRFWALKDISFDINEGDRIGIIGRNGAGKSTLLKILSRITAPTEGLVKIKGRIASLLEVGTGFHAELTGRENIFLNGAILGMKRWQIREKLDEIIAFSELEQFIDTPVKRYSSGMFVRLAFAVASSLDSEILLADEVLAVGDAAFQKKCLGMMDSVSRNQGRTVLFVSHNMNFIESLCEKVIRLERGRIVENLADTREAIVSYLGLVDREGTNEWKNQGGEYKYPEFQPTRFALVDESGRLIQSPVGNDAAFYVQIEGDVEIPDNRLTLGYALYDTDGKVLYWSYHTDEEQRLWPRLEPGHNRIRSRIPAHFLNEGSYIVKLMASIHFSKWITDPEDAAPQLRLTIQGGLSSSAYWVLRRPGVFAPIMNWERK